MTDVVFPVMPFADVGRPALGASLLSAAARCGGVASSVFYFNIDFAERCGLDIYRLIADRLPPDALLGEWLFADLLFGDAIPSAERYSADILSKFGLGPDRIAEILGARARCADFIESCARQVEARRPRVVAFSTTFHQTCACLALAGRLKIGSDSPIVLFGGANCEGEMGVQLLRSFSSIDFVSVQEADQSFPAFLTALAAGQRPRDIPGIIARDDGQQPTKARLVKDLDDLPIPDFGEYFAALRRSSFAGSIVPDLPMETSRGCWWGEKHHCTFCGLNGGTMAYRRKSEDRVLFELRTLTEQSGCRQVFCVDNILDFRFVDTLFPRLEQSELGLELFFEVKANLKHHQLAMLKAGGVCSIQPGIESFSTQVLQLMRKGSTGAQNIQCLRWAEEFGIETCWNILAGFPGEDEGDYDRLAELAPLLEHLPPPACCTTFRMDRFSPYADNPTVFGLNRVRPARAYFYVFPFGRQVLSRLAYYFDYDHADGRSPDQYLRAARLAVNGWQAARDGRSPAPRLDATWEDGGFDVVDTRTAARRNQFHIEDLRAALYGACDSGQSLAKLCADLAGDHSRDEVERELAALVADRLMVHLDGLYLSLAVFRGRPGNRGEQEERPHEAALA